jgi:hypothetical protein
MMARQTLENGVLAFGQREGRKRLRRRFLAMSIGGESPKIVELS